MAYKVVQHRRFRHDVAVVSPIDGGYVTETMAVTFNYIDVEKAAEFDLTTGDGTDAFLLAVVHRIDDLVDENGQPVEWSDAMRDALFRHRPVRRAIAAHYGDAVNHQDIKAGN